MGKHIIFGILFLLVSFLLFSAETGGASWYGGKFQGRLTANGEIFDTNIFTAAHKTLPFNTLVKVTCLSTGKTTYVRINDRGPFIKGRIIDLSRAAAENIDLVGRGVVDVQIDVVKDIKELETTGILDKYPGLRAPEKLKPDRVTIQVASFSSSLNAERVKSKLLGSNFSAVVELSSGGFYQVLLKDIKITEMDNTRDRLAKIGFRSVLVRKN